MGLKITNAASDNPSVFLYGIIGDEYGGITADQFRTELAQIPSAKPIDLHIHSDGGSFFDGVAMHSQLSQRKGPVNVTVDGLAASAASLVAMAGKTITMAQHAWMMIHEAHGIMGGRAADFRAAADRLDATNDEIVNIYSGRWSGTEAELRAALDSEMWMGAEDTCKMGLADCVGESMSIAACVNPLMKYKRVPEVLATAKESPAVIARKARLAELIGATE